MATACLGMKSANKEVKTKQRNNRFLTKSFQFTKFRENEENSRSKMFRITGNLA